ALESRRRARQRLEREVERLAVVSAGEKVADGLRGMAALEEVGNQEEVSLALRHGLALDQQVLNVHPVADEGLAGPALALRDLVLVVGEDEVLPAAVEVEGLAEVLHAHGRALDVPARAAPAERGVPLRPFRLVLLGFPEHEVPGVLLVVL